MVMMKREILIVVVMLIMIVGAQVQAQYDDNGPTSSILPPRRHHKRHCAPKCALKCLLRFRFQPVPFMKCFNLCIVKCSLLPSNSVFSCTSSCVHSKTLTLANSDAQDVEGYVESCYTDCNNNKSNKH